MSQAGYARIVQRSVTTGTGPFELLPTRETGFNLFSSVLADGDVVDVMIVNPGKNEWQECKCTFDLATPDTLTVVKVISSSAVANAAVSFTSGSKLIMLTATSYTLRAAEKLRPPVRVLATTNQTLASVIAGSTLDGVTLAAGDRVALMGQSTATQIGIYEIQSGGSAPVRTNDFAAGDTVSGAWFLILAGTYAGAYAVITNAAGSDIVGTSSLTYFLNGPGVWQPLDSTLTAISGAGTTGSGAVVRATSPTLTTPTIASIVNTGTLTLPTSTDTIVGRATTDTLTNKTLTSPVINTPTLNGSGGALTLPAGPDTIVGRATTDTLTNKTLTSPVINTPTLNGSGGALTLPAGPDTIVGRATTDTLTNKTLTSPVMTNPTLGTAASGNLGNCTGYPVANLAGLGSGVATLLATFSSANLATACTDETGTAGSLVFSASPTLTGTVNAANVTASGNLIVQGNTQLGDGSGDSLTIYGTSIVSKNGLEILRDAVASTAEDIIGFGTSDDSVGRIVLCNASSSDSIFAPRIKGTHGGAGVGLALDAFVTTDTGSNPCLSYSARTTVPADIVTRPLFSLLNRAQPALTVTAGYHLQIRSSSTSPSDATAQADTVQLWRQDAVAGSSELMAMNEPGAITQLTGLGKGYVSSDVTITSNTTLANVTGLSLDLMAGRKYSIHAVLFVSTDISGGIKVTVSGTCTTTHVIFDARLSNAGAAVLPGTSQAGTLGTTVGNSTAIITLVEIHGSIYVDAAGTLTIQCAQNASSGSSTTVKRGSYLQAKSIA